MNFQKTGKGLPQALDDGTIHSGKKRKRAQSDRPDKDASSTTTKTTTTTDATPAIPPATLSSIKILPTERLADFSARVDQALPIAGLKSKGQKKISAQIPGMRGEDRKTKHNQRLERMQTQWREEEARRRAKREEDLEEGEEEREEQSLLWDGVRAQGRRRGGRGANPGKDETGADNDPWAELERSRAEGRQKNLQDVVLAPPQLKGVRSRFKDLGGSVLDVGGVPGRVGSLRKREEVASMRRSVIDGYRKTIIQRHRPAIQV